jgi:hypothetical protein
MITLTVAAALAFVPKAQAQVSFGINIGSAPVCPYGYYSYSPYRCAPYGFYGPEWFSNGVFVGAGPWFHGPRNFYGHVDHHYDPRYGYRGSFPARGEHFDNHRDFRDFHGNAMHDSRGREHRESRGRRR